MRRSATHKQNNNNNREDKQQYQQLRLRLRLRLRLGVLLSYTTLQRRWRWRRECRLNSPDMQAVCVLTMTSADQSGVSMHRTMMKK